MKRLFTVVLAMLIGLSAFAQQLGKAPTANSQQTKQMFKRGSYKKSFLKVRENKNFKSVNTFSNAKSLLNYSFAESTTTFTSIHTTGTAITPDGWDDGYYYLDLTGTFSFNYDLNPISSFSVGTNGYLIMGRDKYPSLSNDLADTGLVPVVAPVWDDLRFYGEGTDCGLFYQIDSLTTDTVLTIEWYNIERYGYEGSKVSFQVKFHTENDVIEIIYGDMSAASDWEASASIGINNREGDATAFMSITPGTPATMSRTEANNTVDGATLASIAEGTVYSFTPAYLNDDLMASAIYPHAAEPGSDVTPQVVVHNGGINDASNYSVNLTIVDESSNDVYNQTLTISDALASGSDTTIDMPVWSAVPAGFFTATLTVTYSADGDNNNNSTTQDITVANSINMQNGDTSVCTMLFYDSGGADGDYQSGEGYTLVMRPSTAGNFLQVNFNSYNIESGYDHLYVYNGTSTSAPLLADLSGTGSDLFIKAMNSDGALTFYFSSDGSVTRDGWEAIVTCYTPPQHDLTVVSVAPAATLADNAFEPKVVVMNNAVNDETSFDLHYSNIDGTYSGTLNLSETIAGYGGKDTITLPAWTLNTPDTLTVYVVLTGDEDNTNDTLVQPIAVINSTTLSGNTSSGEYAFVDLSDASEMAIGSINSSPFPMAEEFDGNTIYRIYADMSFGTVNMLDGTFTSMGTLSGVTGTPTGLAWDWNSNVMYVMVLDGNNAPHLCTLDFSTLQLTEVASNSSGMIIGMDFVNDTLIYAPSLDDDKLYEINVNTGTFTQVGDIGVDLNYGQDVAYDYDSSRLYTITEGGAELLGYYDLTTGLFDTVVAANGQHATFVSLTTPAPLYTVTFNVTDGTNPLANANIQVANRVLHTDASGQATIKLIDGGFSAITSYYGYANDTTDFVVNGSDTTVNITLTALPTYDLAFHVTNILGTEIANASITVLYGTDTLANGTTDANGDFDAGQQYAAYTMHYIVSASGYERFAGDTMISNADLLVNVQLLEKMNPPTSLTYTLTGRDAEISWAPPASISFDPQWIQYDDGENADAIGTGGTADFDVAARFPVSDIAQFDGGVISHVEFWPNESAATYTIKIWQGGDNPTLVYSEEVSNPTIGAMNDITLATPVPIDITQDLWVGYNVNTTTGYPAGIDGTTAVDGFGNMIYYQGSWASLLSGYGLDGNWNIHAYVDAPSKDDKSFLNTYNVYFQDSLVTASPISDTTYLFTGLQDGHYTVGVTALYTTGESEKATIDLVVENTDLTSADEQIVVYPNPVKDVVSIKADGNYTLRVVDIDGRTVLATELHDNTNVVNMSQLPAGVYFLQMNGDNANYNFKIVKK